MPKVEIEVEIDASPERVRAVMMNFDDYAQWHTSFIQSLSTIPPNKDPLAIQPGDKITAAMGGNTVISTIVLNTPSEFRWRGSVLAGAFRGEHYFRFKDSKVNAGRCTFVHGEEFDGWMTWLFGEGVGGVLRGNVEKMFKTYCDDLKRRVEGV